MKIRLFPSFFSVLIGVFILFTTSCKIDYIWHDDVKKFVDDGLAIPIFTAPIYSGTDLPAISEKQMFQIGTTYTASIAVSNPKKISLDYRVRTKSPALFEGITDDIVATGKLKSSSDTVSFSFSLKPTADKNDIEFYLDVWSAMRSYETPKIDTIWVNVRPSPIVPQKMAEDGTLSDVVALEPDFSGSQATIYWSYALTGTNTDIENVKVLYTVNGTPGETEINLDTATGKFGTNSCTVTGVPSGAAVDFSVTVYDTEGLGSEAVATGNFVPQRALVPTFTRDVGVNRNKLIVTAPAGTQLFCRRDSGAFTDVTSPYVIDLVTSHTIQAYTTQYGLLDSTTVSPDYPNYIAQYVVTFNNLDSGSLVKGTPGTSTTVLGTYGSNVIVPENPTRTGWKFVGWYQESSVDNEWYFMSNTIPAHDLQLYAKWIGYIHQVEFEPQNTEASSSANVKSPAVFVDGLMPDDPTKSSYKFVGWFTGTNGSGTEFTSKTVVTAPLTVYACWTPDTNTICTITYNTQGGTLKGIQHIVSGNALSISLPNPTRAGYNFVSWWTLPGGSVGSGTWITSGEIITEDITLYAFWGDPIPYQISYFDGTTNLGNQTSYNVTAAPSIWTNPTRAGFTFAGWYSDQLLTTPVTEIPLGSTGNINLYASWTGASTSTSTVTIHLNNPTDSNAVFTIVDGATVNGTLSLRRGYSLYVTTDNGSYNTYLWTISGFGNAPDLAGPNYQIVRLYASNIVPTTSLGVFTVTLFFGNWGYQYSKSFTVQVTD